MKEEVGTCCDGKPLHEICKTCREEYETWKQSKGSDKDYSSIKNKKKMKKWEESPYSKEAVKEHQRKMRAMNRTKNTKDLNVSVKTEPNKVETMSSSEDIWPRGASWQNKTLTKSAVDSFLKRARDSLIKKEIRELLETLIKENTDDDSKSNKVIASQEQWQRAKAEKPYHYPGSGRLSTEERKAFSERRDAMLRAKFNMPSKQQVKEENELEQQKKEAGKQAFSGDSKAHLIPETIIEKPSSQVEYEKALMAHHENRMKEKEDQVKPKMVFRRSPDGKQAITMHDAPQRPAQTSAKPVNQADSPAELTEEEQNKLEEMMNSIALAHQRRKA